MKIKFQTKNDLKTFCNTVGATGHIQKFTVTLLSPKEQHQLNIANLLLQDSQIEQFEVIE